MDLVQSYIRTEVGRGEFPTPKGAEAFTAYAIASDMGQALIPEMESAARQTLDLPLTYKVLGQGLEGWALHNLANFRRRCRDSLIACLHTFLSDDEYGPSRIWAGCCKTGRKANGEKTLPTWLHQFLLQSVGDLKVQSFTQPFDIHSKIRGEYLRAFRDHYRCPDDNCLKLQAREGFAYCKKLENELMLARNEVSCSFDFRVP